MFCGGPRLLAGSFVVDANANDSVGSPPFVVTVTLCKSRCKGYARMDFPALFALTQAGSATGAGSGGTLIAVPAPSGGLFTNRQDRYSLLAPRPKRSMLDVRWKSPVKRATALATQPVVVCRRLRTGIVSCLCESCAGANGSIPIARAPLIAERPQLMSPVMMIHRVP